MAQEAACCVTACIPVNVFVPCSAARAIELFEIRSTWGSSSAICSTGNSDRKQFHRFIYNPWRQAHHGKVAVAGGDRVLEPVTSRASLFRTEIFTYRAHFASMHGINRSRIMFFAENHESSGYIPCQWPFNSARPCVSAKDFALSSVWKTGITNIDR